jgi:membrane-bound lytic murein transglycosylase MltF
VEDLAGKTVHVRKSSSYHESLLELNARFVREGKPPSEIALVPEALEDEDILELVNAAVFGMTVVDDWKAALWARVLPKITVHQNIALRSGGTLGWAIRKDSSLLAAEIADFFTKHFEATGAAEARLARYHKRIKQIQDPTKSQAWKRFQETLGFFRKYGTRYDFDPLMLTAQGYQESRLDQTQRSPVGAVGIMQLMPATADELQVGDVTIAEHNIHAGTKYMDRLMSTYFKEAAFDANNRVLFAFASYNAGPGRISSMRTLAEKRGLDPNQWFNNVEIVTAEKVGWETTTYVRNILKYYVAYKLALDAQAAREKAHEQLKSGAGS